MTNKFNKKAIHEAWIPMVKAATKGMINESTAAGIEKLNWMAEYAHNHTMAMNEEAQAQVYNSNGLAYNNLYNTMGIGNPVPAQAAGQTGAAQASADAIGSADKWPALLPIALQVAAKTIAFDLVNTTPFSGPTGVIPFLDYVYAGSKQPGGAAPYAQTGRQNPDFVAGKRKGADLYDMPSVFQVSLVAGSKSVAELKKEIGALAVGTEGKVGDLAVKFVGVSRVNGDPIFEPKVDRASNSENKSLLSYFSDDTAALVLGEVNCTVKRPRLVSMLENHILGYSGAGQYDTDAMSGNWADGTHLFENMDRATGETQYPRQLALEVFTKFVTVGTQQIAIACTQEQVTDLNKQWGINVMQMLENAAVNELSMTMNKQILSRLFSLGWKNHLNAFYSEGINLNLNIGGSAVETKGFAIYDEAGVHEGVDAPKMPIPAFVNYGKGTFENRATILNRIATQAITAGNVINQRGRRGPANFIVCNAYIATALQTNANYSFAPIANTFSQNNGSLYPLGTVAGMTVYVDPNMKAGDNRVLVGRKGDKDEPGVHFCPYLLAEKISTIAEATMSPKMVVKSRYALVDVGWYPETQYLTFWVESPDAIFV